MAVPTTPEHSQSQHQAGSEKPQPPSELGSQNISGNESPSGAAKTSPEIPSSKQAVLPHTGVELENLEDAWEDPDSFPIAIKYIVSIFMMANSGWTLRQLQQAILTALQGQGVDCIMLEAYGVGNLTVLWERALLPHHQDCEFPDKTLITEYNIRPVLEFLKRNRSDLVVVEHDNIPIAGPRYD
ncbi:MAG: hypothetical protein Q9225_005849 [Loekoesia sp. 1 TL-2023]